MKKRMQDQNRKSWKMLNPSISVVLDHNIHYISPALNLRNPLPGWELPVTSNASLNISQLRVVLHLCGFLVCLYSLSMLPPMVIALLNKERSYFTFLITFLAFFTLGGLTWRSTKHAGIQLRTRDGFVIIVLFWLLFSLISAMPMWMDDGLQLSFADALLKGFQGSPQPVQPLLVMSAPCPNPIFIIVPSLILLVG
jgi:hypothetical protein